jgi:putative ABC transport system ATP-binding protein
MTVLKTKDLTKIYLQGDEKVIAVNKANIEIKKGEFVSILGPSGSGKTTLLQLIGLLLFPTSGKVYINGKDSTKMSEDERARVRRKEIGFVFQQFNLMPTLDVFENIALPLRLDEWGEEKIKERVSFLLDALSLQHRAHHFPNQLSGGQMQRVAIGRALANNPSIILADEPTGNLDTKHGEDVLNLFKQMHDEGQTIVMITHDKKIASVAERFFFIKDGTIKEVETLEAI